MAWKNMTVRQWQDLLERTPDDQKADVIGLSPGGAAALLNVTRQAVHNAIDRGLMSATRVRDRGKLISINIPYSDIQRYKLEHAKKAS